MESLETYIAYAADRGVVPRIHGNGFIQLDLDGYHRHFVTRLHFWGHPAIPRQRELTDIHDHVFGFQSDCLLGRLFNIRWDTFQHEHGRYVVHTPQKRTGEDTALYPQEPLARVHTVKPRIDVVHVGERYHMLPSEYHETYATEPTVTLVHKLQHVSGLPRILVPFGSEPDNDFNRYEMMPTNDIWTLIRSFGA